MSRYLPETDVTLWETELWQADLDLSEEDPDALISLYIDVVEALKHQRNLALARDAYKELKRQLRAE